MTKNPQDTTTSASGRSGPNWIKIYRSAVIDALDKWPFESAAARVLLDELRVELTALACHGISWSDPDVVARVVRAAAVCEAAAVAQHGGFDEPAVEAAPATSLFKQYVRVHRHDDCSVWFHTFPRRLVAAGAQLHTMPEEASCEVAYVASMLVSDLRRREAVGSMNPAGASRR